MKRKGNIPWSETEEDGSEARKMAKGEGLMMRELWKFPWFVSLPSLGFCDDDLPENPYFITSFLLLVSLDACMMAFSMMLI